jgi:hypothetical protein
MKTSELRIGNYIKLMLNDEDFAIVQVTLNDLEAVDNKKGVYEPLPLTEDWLLKHGFSVKNFDYSIPISECKVVWLTLIPQDEDCSAYSVCVTQKDEDEEDQNAFLSDISYVHQVQNLYFALTGNELKKYEEQS